MHILTCICSHTANDWHAALVPMYVRNGKYKGEWKNTKTVALCHNIVFQVKSSHVQPRPHSLTHARTNTRTRTYTRTRTHNNNYLLNRGDGRDASPAMPGLANGCDFRTK